MMTEPQRAPTCCMRIHVKVSAAAMMLVANLAGADQSLPHELTFRNLSVSVPKLAQAPTLDGTVDPAEWAGAGMMPRMVTFESDDHLTDEVGKFYIGYTDDALWLAWQIQRPKDALAPKAVITQPDRSFWHTDDAIELMINCTPEGREKMNNRDYYMIWNAIGTKYDRRDPRLAPGPALAWTGDWKAMSRTVPDFGWEGEVRVPLDILAGAEKPAGGVRWRFQLCQNLATPDAKVLLSGFQMNWGAFRDYPTLFFTGDQGVFVRVLDSGAMAAENKAGVVLELVNPGTAARTVTPKLRFYKRKPDATSIIPYLRAFDQSRDRSEDVKGEGKVRVMISDEELSKQILADSYTLVKEQKEPVTLPPNQRQTIDFTITKEPGDYLVFYDVRDSEGKVIAGAPLPFVMPEPLAVTTRNFFLVDKSIEVSADMRYVPGWDTKGKIKATFASSKREWSGEQARSKLNFDLPIKDLGPGKYELHFVATDAAGKTIGERIAPITIPETPEWFSKPVGMTPTIPVPWKPIRVSGKKLSFLMGEYELKDSVLPAGIKVRTVFDEEREPILREPVRLHGVVNGQPVEWRGKTKIEEKRDELVHVSSTASAGNVTVNAAAEFEYDGMEKITLDVSAADGQKPNITQLTLSIPFAKGFADLYRANRNPIAPDKVQVKAGSIPAEGWAHDWRPNVWIGNTRRGLEWFAENVRGWRIGKDFETKVIEVENTPEGATLHVHFIRLDPAKPLVLDKPREIIFGMMFTPPRTLNPKSIHMTYGAYGEHKEKLPVDAAAGANSTEIWYWGDHEPGGLQGWPEQRPDRSALYAPLIKRLREHGIKVTSYSGWGISRLASVYPIWGAEMVNTPVIDMACGCDMCCWNTPVTDAYLHAQRQISRDLGYDGYRMDSGFSIAPCSSLKHRGRGSVCGWHDDAGNLQPSVQIFAAREAAKRGYRLYHGPDVTEDGLALHHIHGGVRCAPILSHMDGVVSAEGPEMTAFSIKEFDLSFWRAQVMEDKMGVQVVYGPKGSNLGLDARLAIGALHRLTPRNISFVETQEASYGRSARPSMLVAQAEEWIRWLDAGTKFYGYWENSQFLKTGHPEVYGSFHVRPGKKLLLALLNRDSVPLEQTIRLDLKSLGFKGKVYAHDAILNEPLDIRDSTVTVIITAEGFRLVKIASQPFEVIEPKKISDNLIAQFEPSKWPAQGIPAGWQLQGASNAFSVVNGELVLAAKADQPVAAWHNFTLTTNKNYMFEAEVRVDCDEGAFLGQAADRHAFSLRFGHPYYPGRSLGGELPAGRYETMRIYYSTKDNPAVTTSLSLNGSGKVFIRRLAVFEVDRAKPAFAFIRGK